jgi:FMS-like tyrosine kinase 1
MYVLCLEELLVLVEFCRFGNLHSLLLCQRDNFLDQVDHLRDAIDFSIGTEPDPGRYQK